MEFLFISLDFFFMLCPVNKYIGFFFFFFTFERIKLYLCNSIVGLSAHSRANAGNHLPVEGQKAGCEHKFYFN